MFIDNPMTTKNERFSVMDLSRILRRNTMQIMMLEFSDFCGKCP